MYTRTNNKEVFYNKLNNNNNRNRFVWGWLCVNVYSCVDDRKGWECVFVFVYVFSSVSVKVRIPKWEKDRDLEEKGTFLLLLFAIIGSGCVAA